MVGMGTTWDETSALIASRTGAIAAIALVAMALPTAVSGVLNLYAPTAEPTAASLIGLAGIVATIVMLWGQLGLTALALTDGGRGMTSGQALRAGLAALPRMLLVVVALMVVVVVLMLPVVILLAAAGVDLTRMGSGQSAPLTPAVALGMTGYLLVLTPIALFLFARIALITPVVLAERRHVGAIGRSWRLTRGLTFKLVALVILYGIVALLILSAVRYGLGSLLLVAFGDGERVNVATIGVAILSALTSTALSVVSTLFVATLYRGVVADAPPAPITEPVEPR